MKLGKRVMTKCVAPQLFPYVEDSVENADKGFKVRWKLSKWLVKTSRIGWFGNILNCDVSETFIFQCCLLAVLLQVNYLIVPSQEADM